MIRALICGFLILLFCVEASDAQQHFPSARKSKPQIEPYIEGLKAHIDGRCEDAIVLLVPAARQGIGFEAVQHALGLCLLEKAGAPSLSVDSDAAVLESRRAILTQSSDFQRGLDWILQAANAGSFEAQASLIYLYNLNLAPDEDLVEAAKWAHLYLTNAKRLRLGAPPLAQNAIRALRQNMSRRTWLTGKDRARHWTPIYIAKSGKKDDNKPTETQSELKN